MQRPIDSDVMFMLIHIFYFTVCDFKLGKLSSLLSAKGKKLAVQSVTVVESKIHFYFKSRCLHSRLDLL